MFKKRTEKAKEKIMLNILEGVILPDENTPINKKEMLKIVENIAKELAKTQAMSAQALY